MEAMRAALVEREAGNLREVISVTVTLVIEGAFSVRRMRVNIEGRFDVLYANTAAVVEKEDIDAHEPAAQCPDGVACGGFGERFEDWAEAEEGAID